MFHSIPFSPQRMETHQPQEKSIKLPPPPRDPLQTARTSLRLTNLFLQLTAQQNVPRRSVPTGLLTQLTISETMGSLSGASMALLLPQGSLCVQLWSRTFVLIWSWLESLSLLIKLFIAGEPGPASEAQQQNLCCSSRFCCEMLEFLHKNSTFLLSCHPQCPQEVEGGGNSCSSPLLICATTVITLFTVLLQNSNPL